MTGEAAVDVEDRRWRLGVPDAVAVPAGVPRRVVNLSKNRLAVLHIAMASATPDQTWVNAKFTPAEQTLRSAHRIGPERVGRNDPAKRFELAPRALFQDLYGAELGTSGICGGYGLFEPGARLPCHRHEFDESITILQGTAMCVVEGQRYELTRNATALVPQGRSHYFINLTLEAMAMICVYAGDRPDRIVMDEVFCHPEKAKGKRISHAGDS
jgi:mannose-6-phosphate isomerase-like protein (cupin superfamily)